jgi:hypothetical protein
MEESGSLLHGEGEVMPIYVKPSGDTAGGNKGFIVVLKNMSDRDQEYSFTVPYLKSFLAEEVTVQETVKAQIDVTHQKALILMPPHSLKLVRISQIN